MSGQNWSIQFTSNGLQVDAFGQSGPNLQCQNGDVVSWNNQTNEEHQPYQTDQEPTNQQPTATGPALCDVIAAFKSSTPGYIPDVDTPPSTIYYYCSQHPQRVNEYGQLIVVA